MPRFKECENGCKEHTNYNYWHRWKNNKNVKIKIPDVSLK
jgi:hypothetical protein